MGKRNAGLAALAAIAVLPLAASARTPPALYTAAQAHSGAELYANECSRCHGARFHAGPPITGSGVTVGEIFRYAQRHMPMQYASTLTDDQYVRVMAALLAQNGFPAGKAELTYDGALRSRVPFPVGAFRVVPPKAP